MKAFAIKENYKNEIIIIQIEVEGKAKTYKVTKRGRDFYGEIIKKENINKFNKNDRQVVCFEIEKGIIAYKEGIEKLMEEEMERHNYAKNKLMELMVQLSEIETIN